MGKYATCPACGGDDAWIRAGERVCNHCESALVIVKVLKVRPASVAWAATEYRLELELEAEWERRRDAGKLGKSRWGPCDDCGGVPAVGLHLDGAVVVLCAECRQLRGEGRRRTWIRDKRLSRHGATGEDD